MMSSPSAHSRSRLFGEWLVLIITGTIIFTMIGLAIYLGRHPEDSTPFLKTLQDLLLLSPIAWIAMGLLGPLWIVLAGLFCTLKTRSRKAHLITIAGTGFFGLMWPSTCVMWMGV